MSINLAERKPTKNIMPPRIVLYGPPKIGKTTLVSQIPHNIMLDFEGGSGAVDMARVEKNELSTYDEFLGVLQGLGEQEHNFSAVTLDTADWLEALIFTEAARQHNKTSIADVPYGAGYVTAQNLWRQTLEILDYLREHKGIMPILLAHEQQKLYSNPMGDNYDRFGLKLRTNDKGASSESIIKEWSDVIGFINRETFVTKEKNGLKESKKGKTNDRVFIHLQETPAFLAGNRYGLPAQVEFSWEALSAALTTALT